MRQKQVLGPRAMLDTVLAQQELVSGLLSGMSLRLRPRLLYTQSRMLNTVGSYFVELDDYDLAVDYYGQARVAAHNVGDPTYQYPCSQV